MKLLDRIAQKFTKSASSAVKSEVKKTAIDLLPTAAGILSMILGIVIFKETVNEPEEIRPAVTHTSITTNNYFFQEMSEEMIKKIVEGNER